MAKADRSDTQFRLRQASPVFQPEDARFAAPICWTASPNCLTMQDMKSSALTIRLDPKLDRQLARVAKHTGRSRSEVVRDAVRRQLALAQFQDLRRRVMPLAEARGYVTDEDVFRDVS